MNWKIRFRKMKYEGHQLFNLRLSLRTPGAEPFQAEEWRRLYKLLKADSLAEGEPQAEDEIDEYNSPKLLILPGMNRGKINQLLSILDEQPHFGAAKIQASGLRREPQDPRAGRMLRTSSAFAKALRTVQPWESGETVPLHLYNWPRLQDKPFYIIRLALLNSRNEPISSEIWRGLHLASIEAKIAHSYEAEGENRDLFELVYKDVQLGEIQKLIAIIDSTQEICSFRLKITSMKYQPKPHADIIDTMDKAWKIFIPRHFPANGTPANKDARLF